MSWEISPNRAAANSSLTSCQLKNMVVNIRHYETKASVHPQYNMINVVYRLYVQIFERIEKKQYPDYVNIYMEANGITMERVLLQKKLIADLLDGLLSKEYTREPGTEYLRKAMRDCRWSERFDWAAMTVFDMLASQSMLAYFFNVFAELASEEDVKAQNPCELREIVDRQCRHASEIITRLV